MTDTISTTDIITIVAIFLAPFFAVQTSIYLEQRTAKRNARLNIFKTLMATRASQLSPDHVMALNRIDLEFKEKNTNKLRMHGNYI